MQYEIMHLSDIILHSDNCGYLKTKIDINSDDDLPAIKNSKENETSIMLRGLAHVFLRIITNLPSKKFRRMFVQITKIVL